MDWLRGILKERACARVLFLTSAKPSRFECIGTFACFRQDFDVAICRDAVKAECMFHNHHPWVIIVDVDGARDESGMVGFVRQMKGNYLGIILATPETGLDHENNGCDKMIKANHAGLEEASMILRQVELLTERFNHSFVKVLSEVHNLVHEEGVTVTRALNLLCSQPARESAAPTAA